MRLKVAFLLRGITCGRLWITLSGPLVMTNALALYMLIILRLSVGQKHHITPFKTP